MRRADSAGAHPATARTGEAHGAAHEERCYAHCTECVAALSRSESTLSEDKRSGGEQEQGQRDHAPFGNGGDALPFDDRQVPVHAELAHAANLCGSVRPADDDLIDARSRTETELDWQGQTWIATIREDFVSTTKDRLGDDLTVTETYVTRDAWEQHDGKWRASSSEVVEQAVRFTCMTREAYNDSRRQAAGG